ncbi:unnamed protein product [Anisakis simplex]|uniref:TATA box-binding protein-like 1 n=1 Tax=Anisakis simplex TaxID=6269 RepID=A0A0M3K0I9_ANISI|nr:unnamed protein product [Anisakis simplex]
MARVEPSLGEYVEAYRGNEGQAEFISGSGAANVDQPRSVRRRARTSDTGLECMRVAMWRLCGGIVIGSHKMSMTAYQNDHGGYFMSVASASSESSSNSSIRTHPSSHMLNALPSSASSAPTTTAHSNAVTVAVIPSFNSASLLPRSYSTPQMRQTTVNNASHSYGISITPHQQQQSVELLSRSNALSLNVPLREDEPEQLGLLSQPNNISAVDKQQLTQDAPPSTSAAVTSTNAETKSAVDDSDANVDGEIDIQIRNVVCTYTLPLHIDLHRVALNCGNVTLDRGRGVLLKQSRNPCCYVKIYSSGKVYIVGCRSESECKRASRGIARLVQKCMGKVAELVRIRNYRVCNVLATCKMPFGVRIEEMAEKFPETQYEPELSVGLVWKLTDPKATLRVHTTGSVTVTGAQSEADVMRAIEFIYPTLVQYRCALRLRPDANQNKRQSRRPVKRKMLVEEQRKNNNILSDSNLSSKRQRQSCNISHNGGTFTAVAGSSGVIGNRVYFSDEDEDDLLQF